MRSKILDINIDLIKSTILSRIGELPYSGHSHFRTIPISVLYDEADFLKDEAPFALVYGFEKKKNCYYQSLLHEFE